MSRDIHNPDREESQSNASAADVDTRRESTPGLWLMLNADLTIAGASDAYRRATLLWAEEIRGCGVFDVFPDNPHDPKADGVHNLRASLQHVLRHGEPHRMAIQRYDVRDHIAGDRVWVEKFWAPVNTPVFGGGSREVTHILHHVTDVTRAVALRSALGEEARALEEQRVTLQRMRQELTYRQREVRAAQESLAGMLRAGNVQEPALQTFETHFGMVNLGPYLGPGDRAPQTGFYKVYHQHKCELPSNFVHMRGGKAFPRCPWCRDGVLYRHVAPGR
jgi:hypothetical protein